MGGQGVKKLREAPNASRALFWSFSNTAVSRLGTLGIGIVLARVLGPEEFGTYAVAFIALVAILSINEFGVSLAIVRWPGDPREIAPTVTTISLVGSAIFCIGGYLAAPWFAGMMGDPEATGVVQLLVLSVLVNGIVATPAAMLQREYRQGTRMIIDQVNVWIGAVLSVTLALLGWGAMSLAVGRVAGTLVSAVLFLAFSPLPYRLGFDRGKASALFSFGLPLAGASLIVFFVGYADQLVAGHLLGATMLGFFVLAFNLASWPVSMFSQPLRSVAPTAFSRLQHDQLEMNLAFRAILRVLAAAAVPVCFFLAGAADPVVRFVYGDEWAPAAVALTWLALLAAFRIVFELAYDFLVVLRKTGSLLGIQLWWLAALVPALIVGALWFGLAGIGIAQVVVAGVVVLPLYLVRLKRSGILIRQMAAPVGLPLAAGLLVLGAGLTAGVLIDNPLIAALPSGLLTLAVMGLLLHRERETLRSLRGLGKIPAPAGRSDGGVMS
ncbi:oligosaccharide flippase family protein [Cryobacterium serini]|uniref:Polysaccharide biosynthesis protein n=1 Tax=Cryobacterium serini TaxID=1259201 RepID=A0A4R9BUW1_9MICO|nr:oligosaccharide flippase family protein [Cryobacterium serini]TFD91463.1 polysaccharide biosynthesis protein [Cryobacterium serini]